MPSADQPAASPTTSAADIIQRNAAPRAEVAGTDTLALELGGTRSQNISGLLVKISKAIVSLAFCFNAWDGEFGHGRYPGFPTANGPWTRVAIGFRERASGLRMESPATVVHDWVASTDARVPFNASVMIISSTGE
ncbi:hypothetical protein [Denitratisoma sp. DHT3]|uniref:hypothetical protein n=1 Tax=Denitratisoma sp. DHT3 TaxID=1981880 RepID=UPI001644D725|nr:hypothetical protein [Denitratisoma sp. DHT3]